MERHNKNLVKIILVTFFVTISFTCMVLGGINNGYSIDIGEPPQNESEYAAWKQSVVNNTYTQSVIDSTYAMVSDYTTLGSTEDSISNDYIEFTVENEGEDNGRFTVGTTGGNPDNEEDDYKLMLYGHPYPGTSYTSIWLDGSVSIYNPTTQYPTPDLSNLSNTSEYTIGNVSVKQIIEIINSTSTGRDDTVQVKYIVTNNDAVEKNYGLRIMMDTMLGDNDAAPFRIPGIGAVTSELELSGDSIPEYWQAFDSLTNPTVISQGTLLRSLDNKPDKVQFTNWSHVYDTEWDYAIDSGYSNGDSAVSVCWNPKPLASGETREYVTYYGLSEFVQDLRPPLGVSLSGASNIEYVEGTGYNPNPFTVTAYIMNNGSASANNVSARIVLPSGLALAPFLDQQEEYYLGDLQVGDEKQVSWEIGIQEATVDTNLTYSVIVSADNTETKTVSKDVFIPATITQDDMVIIVPGAMATSLFNNGEQIWMPNMLNLFSDISSLQCDELGNSVQSIDAGDPMDDYYGTMYRALRDNGYDVYYFGYDWRLGVRYNSDKLAEFINNKTYLNGKKVTLVAHSMGGLVSTKYIKDYGPGKVNKLITLGTPYLGSVKALNTFETGDLFTDFLKHISVDTAINDKIKQVASNMPSIYELLPTSNYFNYNNTYYVSEYIDNPWPKKNDENNIYSFEETNNLIKGRDWSNSYLLEYSPNSAINFHNSLDLVSTLQSVDSYFICGDTQPTMGKIRLKYVSQYGGTLIDNKADDIESINGDGTVPLISADIGGRTNWIHENHTYYTDVEHGDLPRNTSVINQVLNILGGSYDEYYDFIRPNYQTNDYLKMVIDCPVHLHVFDDSGNHLGMISDSDYEENIHGSSYYILDDKEIAFLKNNNYEVKLVGTGEGHMTYTLQKYNGNDNLEKTVRFDNVEITSSTIIKSNTDLSNTITLQVDENGDGTVDKTIQPSVVLDAQGSNDRTPPSVSFDVYGTQGNNGWYTSGVTVSISAQDNESGVNRIEYMLNNSEIQKYSEPLNLTSEGINTIFAVPFDNNENRPDAVMQEIKIDTIVPTANATPAGGLYDTPQSVTLTASEQAAIYYTIDGSEPTTGSTMYTEPINANASMMLKFMAVDDAGNQSVVYTETYTIQNIQAEISCNPYVLNSNSAGLWIVAYIELPEGCDVSSIDLNSVKLNHLVPAINDPKYGFVSNPVIEDRDGNGLPEFMVKFDRTAVIQILNAGENVVTLGGNISYNGEAIKFEGTTTITVNQ